MPMYEYKCTKCGHEFEVIQKFSDSPVKKCKECNGPLEKLISRSAIQFKGTGWYVTDYAKKSPGDSGSRSQKSSSSSSSSDSADKDSKGSGDSATGGSDKGSSKKSDSGESGKSGDSKISKPKSGS